MRCTHSRIFLNKRHLNSRKGIIFGIIFFFFLISAISVIFSRNIKKSALANDNSTIYDIVLDAGSSGSRIHVFVFNTSENSLNLCKDHFKRVEPGLASFAPDTDAAVASLRPLLDLAISSVPESHRAKTAVTLKATAGMRLLPEHQQVFILKAVDNYLSSTPFLNRGVSVITGSEEAVFGWMTLNYLLKRFHSDKKQPTVAIDMGGASTQVVFDPPVTSVYWVPFRYIMHLVIRKQVISLYKHSYIGFGLNEARKTILKRYEQEYIPACSPHNSIDASYEQDNDSENGESRQDFDVCTELIREAMFSTSPCQHPFCGIESTPQPVIDSTVYDIYAFSFYSEKFGKIVRLDKPLMLENMRNVAKTVCNGQPHPENKGLMCLDLAYLYTYLKHGLKFSDTTVISVADQIKGHSLSWPLGHSLSFLLDATIINS